MTQSSIQSPVTIQELLVSSLAQTDALAKLLIEKGLINREEFMQKISEERGTYPEAAESYAAMNIGEILIWESSYDAVFRLRCAGAAFSLGFAFSMLCLSACIRSIICACRGASGAV
jgi:hypothetical protein